MFFFGSKVLCYIGAKKKKKNVKKIGQFSEAYISQTTKPIFLKFGMQSRVYAGHKIYQFDRNQCSGYRDMRC